VTRIKLNSLTGKRIHFIGIGGAGMSGLARIALSHAIIVSGSDAKDSSVVKALQALGASISTKHGAENVEGADLVVYSTAIAPSNPEMVRAQELGLKVLTRAAALAVLMSESKSIAVAGTHGKTTTSSMLAVALQACGEDPSFAIGGTITASGSNAHRGTGNIFVAEADESDGSFVEYHPFAAIVTNVEHDHVDFFATPADVERAFQAFAATINPQGFLTYCADDSGARTLVTQTGELKTISYGVAENADLRLDHIELGATGSKARALWHGKAIGFIELVVPGQHNLLNAAAVLATGIELGFAPADLLTGLATFRGTGRRFAAGATGCYPRRHARIDGRAVPHPRRRDSARPERGRSPPAAARRFAGRRHGTAGRILRAGSGASAQPIGLGPRTPVPPHSEQVTELRGSPARHRRLRPRHQAGRGAGAALAATRHRRAAWRLRAALHRGAGVRRPLVPGRRGEGLLAVPGDAQQRLVRRRRRSGRPAQRCGRRTGAAPLRRRSAFGSGARHARRHHRPAAGTVRAHPRGPAPCARPREPEPSDGSRGPGGPPGTEVPHLHARPTAPLARRRERTLRRHSREGHSGPPSVSVFQCRGGLRRCSRARP